MPVKGTDKATITIAIKLLGQEVLSIGLYIYLNQAS